MNLLQNKLESRRIGHSFMQKS